MWTHAVLEVYDLDGIGFGVSTEEMADRIDEGKYAWCVVEDDLVVYFMPLWKILWIKLKKYVYNLYSNVDNLLYPIYKGTPWGKKEQEKWDEFFDETEISEEEFREIFPDEEWFE